jgi:hypothetical protein
MNHLMGLNGDAHAFTDDNNPAFTDCKALTISL